MTMKMQTQTKRLAYPIWLFGATITEIKDSITDSYTEARNSTPRTKTVKAAWATVLTVYTVADDIPAGFVYATLTTFFGTTLAVFGVAYLSATLAFILGMIQKNRILKHRIDQGTRTVVHSRSYIADLVSTYGIGAPGTVLSYRKGTVPTNMRILLMALFYGLVGQGLSYAGFEFIGTVINVQPKVMLAIGIVTAVFLRYASEAHKRGRPQ
jgi:hypothetical protein